MVILLFVAYQLWGTQLLEARSQRELRADFQQRVAASEAPLAANRAPGAASPDRARATLPELAAPTPALAPPSPGEVIGIIRIPKLGIDKAMVEGTDAAALRKGPGHQPGTALPGEPGNAVLAGHRTTYGAPFSRLDELNAGDAITVQTIEGEFHYTVTGSQVVEPTDVWILDPTPDDRLTLFTCTPRFSAARRLVVTAELDSAPVPQASSAPARRTVPSPLTAVLQPEAELAAATGSVPSAAGWAAAALLTAVGIWWAGRRYRRLIAYPIGAPVLAAVLFMTFERVAALLPAAV